MKNIVDRIQTIRISKKRRIASRDTNGNIDRILNGTLEGWVKNRSHDNPLQVDILLDGSSIEAGIIANKYRQDVEEAGIGNGLFGFACPIPSGRIIIGKRIEVRSANTDSILLEKIITEQMVQNDLALPQLSIVSDATTAPDNLDNIVPTVGLVGYESRLEVITDTLLQGWAVDVNQRGKVFDIDIFINDVFLSRIRNDHPRGDLLRHDKSEGLGGFQLNLALNEMEAGSYTVAAVMPDGKKFSGMVKAKRDKQRSRLNAGVPEIKLSDTMVVVPVYNAADDVEICIQRLLQFNPPELSVLMIDDASTDPRIATLLDKAEQYPGFRVLRNSENLGFTRTVNRGLDEIGQKHAILLNSDARVTPGWAQGMLRAAASRPRVSTVTAMSDRAGAFSAPKIGNENRLPAGVDEITYARAFRRRALGLYPVVPTGNGFCMFVNRACINEIGPLDAEAFPRGYGEENDFCMRAVRAGWDHLVDDRTYVFHDRSKSFGETKTDLMAAGRKVIDARYPEYKTAIRTYTAGSDLIWARFRAGQALNDCKDPDAGKPVILFVVATQTGGTPQTNMDLMQEVADEAAPWLLHCDSRNMTLSRLNGSDLEEIETHILSEAVDPLSHRSAEYDAVVRDWLEIANPRIVHIRHLAWHGLSLPALAKKRGSKVVFSFHDYYTLCPTVKLLDENGIFCGGTCTRTDGDCAIELWDASGMPRIKDTWVHVWRDRFAEILKECDAYVTTSDSAKDRLVSQLDLDADRFFVIPHGRNFTKLEQLRQHPRHGEPVRILVPGNICAAKGREIIKALHEMDHAGLFEFHILGNISDRSELRAYKRIFFHGTYKRDDFADRVAKLQVHMGAVFSIWDETYCHTLTELWSTGIPALVFDFPTVAGRVRDSGAGWVVPHEDIKALYDRLIEISFDQDEQMKVDQALLRWQNGPGVGRSTKLMAAAYREVYRHALGDKQRRPMIAVVCPASPTLKQANASTEIRIWERTINNPDRPFNFVRMTPQGFLANLRDGIVDGAILQRNVIPSTMVQTLIREMHQRDVKFLLDLDDNLLAVPPDKDPTGAYAAYAPHLEALLTAASVVTTSTEPLQKILKSLNPNTRLLPNRLSERLWRGTLPARENDGVVRALYMGTVTHEEDFAMIAPALEEIVTSDPGFRVSVIGVTRGALPPWAERIDVPETEKSYACFVPWLKTLSAQFDFGLAPLTDAPFNMFKSNLKALDYGALGLPVLASDMPMFKPLAGKLPGLTLVKAQPKAWQRALTTQIAEVREGAVDREGIRAGTLAEHGLGVSLEMFDHTLRSLLSAVDVDQP